MLNLWKDIKKSAYEAFPKHQFLEKLP